MLVCIIMKKINVLFLSDNQLNFLNIFVVYYAYVLFLYFRVKVHCFQKFDKEERQQLHVFPPIPFSFRLSFYRFSLLHLSAFLLFFKGVPAKEADYWFLDKSLQWHYITDDFQSYFRLMISNIGLPQWQYLYTEYGISPSVQVCDQPISVGMC